MITSVMKNGQSKTESPFIMSVQYTGTWVCNTTGDIMSLLGEYHDLCGGER